jgi:hypothetical protein
LPVPHRTEPGRRDGSFARVDEISGIDVMTKAEAGLAIERDGLGLGDPVGVIDVHGDFLVARAGPSLAGDVEYEFARSIFEGDALHVKIAHCSEVRWYVAAGTGPVVLERAFDAYLLIRAAGVGKEQEMLMAGIVAAVPGVVEDAVPVEVTAVLNAVTPPFHDLPARMAAHPETEEFLRRAALGEDLVDGATVRDFADRKGAGGNGFGWEEIPDYRSGLRWE